MARRKRSSVTGRLPVRYNDGIVSIEYVPRTPAELVTELARVKRSIGEVARIMSTLKRVRHPVIKSVRFQLEHAFTDLPEDTSDQKIADELARLSYLMEDTLNILNKLKHCRIEHLETARFKLTFGQTPKKRDPPEKGSRKLLPSKNGKH